jgi:hypothetical protein
MATALVMLLSLALAPAAVARPATAGNTWTVGGACGTTIQACINTAANGDTVFVPPGTYTEWLWINKPVSLIGSGAETTIVRSSDSSRPALTLYGRTAPPANIDTSTIISGCTFTGGNSTTSGGGISLRMLLTPTIQNVRVTGNQSAAGGGIGVDSGASAIFSNVVITGNVATGANGFGGGGLIMLGNTIWLNNVLVADNQDGSGHGQIEVLGGTAYLKHVTLATAGLNPAAGLVTRGGTAIINNTIVASQTIGFNVEAGSLSGDYDLFYRNLTNTLNTAAGLHDALGDPAFVDAARGNYRLLDRSAAIDRGLNVGIAFDLDGDARPFGAGYDIGFDEHRRPTITITSPSATQIISSATLRIPGLTTPSDQISQVDLSTDNGSTWSPSVGAPTFTYTWTLPSEDGVSHVLIARGTDRTRNLGWSNPVTITVDRIPPQVSITAPSLGQVITQQAYTLTATASDGTGVAQVQLSTDNGVTWHNATRTGAAWSYLWPVPDEDGVSHLLRVSARDVAGNVNTPPASVAVFVDTVPPTITFTTIAPGQIVTTDPITIAGYSTGAVTTTLNLGAGSQVVSSAGFAVPLYTHANGSYVITATAIDAVGNRTTKVVPITVEVPPQIWPCVPCTTVNDLQAAIDAARLGDMVVISTGLIVHGPVTVPAGISLVGGPVHSWPDAAPGDGATILGDGMGPVITIDGALPQADPMLTTTIADLTITGGSADLGGGILITGGAISLIAGNVITANTANVNGSAVAVTNHSAGTLDGNRIQDNVGPDGSAVYVDGTSQLLMINNLILRNVSGAIEAALGAHLTAYHNDLLWNYVGLVSAGTTTVTNNIIFENAGVGLARLAGRLTADYNDLAHNAPDRSGLLAGAHDQSSVPLWNDRYHLSSTAPQVDAGDPIGWLTHDAAGLPRPIGDRPDLGAYEYGNNLVHQVFLPLVYRNYDPARDAFEPDDTFAQARPIQIDEVQHHNFYPANDVDWIRLDTTPGTYLINTLNLAANTDTVLRLYASNGVTKLAENDDCSATTRASCLAWQVTTGGTLYLLIAPYDQTSSGSEQRYDVTVVKQ